jgi:hypothetical protein
LRTSRLLLFPVHRKLRLVIAALPGLPTGVQPGRPQQINTNSSLLLTNRSAST